MLRSRWLGRVAYDEAHDLQRALFDNSTQNHLLLLEHPHVFTMGRSGDASNVLIDPISVGAQLRRVDRGGDVTYHGPGQLVGYPIVSVAGKRGGGMADTVAYVRSVEQLIIDVLVQIGMRDVGRLDRFPGVWVEPDGTMPRKIAAVGVRLSRGRSMHGFALNVDPDLTMFSHIVPCGIPDKAVTSIAVEGIDADMRVIVDAVAHRAAKLWGGGWLDSQDVVWRDSDVDLTSLSGARVDITSSRSPKSHRSPGARLTQRLTDAGVSEGLAIATRKPEWLRAKVNLGPEYQALKSTMRSLDLVTVCEEAACPNIYECWAEGTATFMINGERCTRACGFCHVDTRLPMAVDPDEPGRVAEAVVGLRLRHAVVTAVARDDLDDGGASAFAETIGAIRDRSPATKVEVLIPDLKGDACALGLIIEARPDVMNHNLETVNRLQRAVRPSASYARSLALLARSKQAGLVVKSGVIVGMGETTTEVEGALADLSGVGCDIVTIGQYLRPTPNHLPVDRWVPPDEFDHYRDFGTAIGIGHVEASPLTRSSYHAGSAAEALSIRE